MPGGEIFSNINYVIDLFFCCITPSLKRHVGYRRARSKSEEKKKKMTDVDG